MTFPQSSVPAVLNGQQFWRLNTTLSTSGDIYEAESSALAFCLGPESDISQILITYFDPTKTATNLSQFVLSPDRTFVGRIDATDQDYPLSNMRGRILISAFDVFDASWLPSGFNPATDKIQIEQPVIDVLQYFLNPPSLTPARSDRSYRYEYFQNPTAGAATWIAFPAYGRKSGTFTFINGDALQNVTVDVWGVKFGLGSAPNLNSTAVVSGLFSQVLAPTDDVTFVYNSSVKGLFDYFAISFTNYRGDAMPTTVALSDDPL